jgi:hypothetical protein
MQIAKAVDGPAAFAGAALAHADGFAITSMPNGREMRLFEHAAECNGRPGAFM